MPEIEISVIGNYEVDSGIVTVTYNGRKKSSQLGGSPAEYIAQRLLREIIEDPAGRSGPRWWCSWAVAKPLASAPRTAP